VIQVAGGITPTVFGSIVDGSSRRQASLSPHGESLSSNVESRLAVVADNGVATSDQPTGLVTIVGRLQTQVDRKPPAGRVI
jgi:hypothetical protein